MSTDHRFDQAAARQFEAIYQVPKVVARRRQTLSMLDLQAGEQVLDIGVGPGYFASEVAAAVGPTGQVWGIDASESMLGIARATCVDHANVYLRQGDAVQLGFPDESFDAALVVQVYAYVQDIPAALAELYRVLKPGGRAVIADIDWGSMIWHSTDQERMVRFKKAMDEHFAQPNLPRHLPPLLNRAGLAAHRLDSVVMLNTEIDPYMFGLTKLFGRFITGRHGITAEEVAAWEADLEQLVHQGAYFFSANQFLFLVKKS